ncbi:UNVERIFIED_ORG: hypothetical protein [Escherichia phage CMSTMSU]
MQSSKSRVADEEEFSLDLSGQPQLESVEEEEEEEIIEEEFDFSRMLSLAGLQDEPEDEYSVEGNPDTEVKVEENTFLPDLTISEDEEQGDSTDFGPYNTEADAVRDGQAKTNGVEGDHFVVITKGNKFYWRRVVDEDVDNRPEPEYYDNDGNENRVHKFEPKFPCTALGDNPLNVNESDESVEGNEELEDESDEEVEDIFESLQKKYQQFLGTNKMGYNYRELVEALDEITSSEESTEEESFAVETPSDAVATDLLKDITECLIHIVDKVKSGEDQKKS